MSNMRYENRKQLKEQISLLKFKIKQSKLDSILGIDKVSKDNPDINLSQIQIPDLKKYIYDLHSLILKLSEYSQNHNQKERQMLYDVRSAMKFAQIMRQNLMKPLSAQEFTQQQGRQYRVLLNIYLRNQLNISNRNPQKDSYLQSISEIDMYNSRLQQKVKQINQRKQQVQTIQSLRETKKFLQSENQYLKKENDLISSRMSNYLSLKSLNQSQQNYIKQLKEEIQQKQNQIKKLIQQVGSLKEKLYLYGQGDRKASQEMKVIKTNFLEYFSNKKKNYQSNLEDNSI